ncbi:MAG: hypothetical protein E8A46_00485 [Bradyrhizobium sp.]|jgi:hypothetical protein|uniref:hypothetical protein n=1 Tax=Bradyrhizobium sp. TaxID=376 RepID=UPI00121F2869|nr:hypothetical protein [Bradyrhizobium sp.]THD57686.1 MAG: hypothetical protein E8A46_00485 [Bradyrhizobium sp.]
MPRQQRAVNVSPSRPIEIAFNAAKSRTLQERNWLYPKHTFLRGWMCLEEQMLTTGGLSLAPFNSNCVDVDRQIKADIGGRFFQSRRIWSMGSAPPIAQY